MRNFGGALWFDFVVFILGLAFLKKNVVKRLKFENQKIIFFIHITFYIRFNCQYYGIKVYMCIAIPCLTNNLLALAIQYFCLLSNCHLYLSVYAFWLRVVLSILSKLNFKDIEIMSQRVCKLGSCLKC